jgi:hypothetical protein
MKRSVRANEDNEHEATHLDMSWRQVWLWSAVISAVLSVTITLGILGYPGSAAHSLRQCLIIWASYTAMLTLTGVFSVLRVTSVPHVDFEKRRKRQTAGLARIRQAPRQTNFDVGREGRQ